MTSYPGWLKAVILVGGAAAAWLLVILIGGAVLALANPHPVDMDPMTQAPWSGHRVMPNDNPG